MHSKNALSSHHRPKPEKLRLEIRSRQIEEYKDRIRQQFVNLEMSNERNGVLGFGRFGVGSRRGAEEEIDMGMCRLEEISESEVMVKMEIRKIGEELMQIENKIIQDFLISLEDQFYDHQHQHGHLKQAFCEQLDKIIFILLNLEEENPKFAQPKHRQNIIRLLELTVQHSKRGISLWKMEQRCIVSYFYSVFFEAIKRDGAIGGHVMSWLAIAIDYLTNILIKNQKLTGKRCRKEGKSPAKSPIASKYSMMNINQIQELLLQQIIEIYTEQMLKMSLKYGQSRNNEEIMNKIVVLYAWYCRLFINEVKADEYLNESLEPSIGNVKLQVIKSVLNLSYSSTIDIIQEGQQSLPLFFGSSSKIQSIINNAIDLFVQFCAMFEYLSVEEAKCFEERSSEGMFGTAFGLGLGFAELVIDVGESIVQGFKEQDREDSLSEPWFTGIKNRDLVLCLKQLLERNIYSESYLKEVCSQSQLSIYLLTSIFTELPQSEPQCTLSPIPSASHQESYPRFRSLRRKETEKANLELQCLKLIHVLHQKYGILVDEEGNLQLRYLRNVGDGTANAYFFQVLVGLKGKTDLC